MQTIRNKVAITTMLIVVIGGGTWFLGRMSDQGYALAQTIEANRNVRFLHVMWHGGGDGARPGELFVHSEIWVELDASGKPLRIRTETRQDEYFTVSVAQDHIARGWDRLDNEWITAYAIDMERRFERDLHVYDPRVAAEILDRLVAEEKVDLETRTLGDGDIELTFTPRPEAADDLPFGWFLRNTYVILVDAETRLFRRIDRYHLAHSEPTHFSRIEYLDYEAPVDPLLFVLEPPPDAKVVDLVTGIGMAQEEMTDAEAAVEVLRQYLTAMIDKDYEEAARLYLGTRPERLRKREEKRKLYTTRIVWLGEPVPDEERERAYFIPFTYEYETESGERKLAGPPSGNPHWGPQKHRKAFVRPLPDKPDRWVVNGGI